MKTKYFASMLMLLCVHCTQAQNKTTILKVFLQTAKNDSASHASIQLFALNDSVAMATQLFNKSGNSFTVTQLSKYTVTVSCIGFATVSKTINVTDKPLTTTLFLKRSSTYLKAVVVTSKKPLIKQEDDKTIVDATVLANSSTNAYEVLEKTPGAIVDQDGNVYLSSMNPATVFINGREMKLSSEDLASLLKSLPASSVSKIEIQRNPSAKYDAASSGGIVNIVLKKGVKLGSSGSINVGYFQGIYSNQTAGVNINKSAGKINSYFSYQFTNSNNFTSLISSRFVAADNSLLSQKAFTKNGGKTNYIGGGIDYAFSKKFNVGYDVRVSLNNSKSNSLNSNNIANKISQLLLANNQSGINNKSNTAYIGNNFSGKYKIDSLGSEWTSEVDYTYYKSDNHQLYANSYFLPVNPVLKGDGTTDGLKKIITAQTDVTFKLPKKFTLEAGLKITSSNSQNSADYILDTGTVKYIDAYQTNTFKYKETISAAYLQVAKTVWGFTIKPGLRLETTSINGRQIIPKDTSLSIKRTDLFPFVYIRHKLFKMFGFPLIGNAIFRKSIKRPYYESLNPYPKYIDPYLFETGNPRLKPQFTTNYEFNVMFDDFPVVAVGVNDTKDIFSIVTYQNDSTKIAYRTYDNLGTNKETYFRLVGGIPPGGKYFFYVGAQYNLYKYDGFYQNKTLNYQRGRWFFFMYQEFKASKSLTLDMEGYIVTKALQNLYEIKNLGNLIISANKSILNKKANIIFSVNDVFKTNKIGFTLNQANINATGSRINDTRRAGITFRYNFGLSKPKDDKEFGAAPAENKDN